MGWLQDGPISLLSKEGGRAAAGVVSNFKQYTERYDRIIINH